MNRNIIVGRHQEMISLNPKLFNSLSIIDYRSAIFWILDTIEIMPPLFPMFLSYGVIKRNALRMQYPEAECKG